MATISVSEVTPVISEKNEGTSVVLVMPTEPVAQTCRTRVTGIASNLFHAMTEIFGKKQPAFERSPGVWYQPGDEDKTGFFHKLMPLHSQRENWHAVSPYITEFWSCFSNTGFLYAGCRYREPLIVAAGVASVASHAIPKNWLLYVDKAGAGLACLSLVRHYKTFIQEPWLFAPMAGIAAIFGADNYYFAQTLHYNWPHILWHISAACGCCLVFQMINKNCVP
jgi:hypothetical protein